MDWYPIIRRFLDQHPVTRPCVTIDPDGLPSFLDWRARGQFSAWLIRRGYEFDEGADLPPPGPRQPK